MGEAFHVWRLCEGDDAKRGLACDENGLRLGGVALIERSEGAYRIRPEDEISRLVAARYGAGVDGARLMPGLAVIAKALDSGNLCLATIAAVQLRMPDLSDTLASAELQIEAAMLRLDRRRDALTRSSEDQPRWPAGAPESQGGRFAPPDAGTAGSEQIAQNSRDNSSPQSASKPPYVATKYRQFTRKVGDGECVPLVEKATGAPVPATSWREGESLADHPDIPEGTAIATFVNGKYPNAPAGNHAAIFVRYATVNGRNAIIVYDQYWNRDHTKHFIGERPIYFDNRRPRQNNAYAYSVVR